MKTIAVLTDFSACSEHAAKYALHVAQKIKANVLLFNAFLVPTAMPMAAAVAWPDGEYEQTKAESEKSLTRLCNKLKHEVKTRPLPGTFLPTITCRCEAGSLLNALAALEQDQQIVLLIAGTHQADAITTFVMGDHSRELIDSAGLPLLLVPERAPIRNIEKIVYATDLDPNDLHYLRSLAGLAHPFGAQILIANVEPEVKSTAEHQQAENSFMEEVVRKVDYKQVSYQTIAGQKVKKGLAWVLENERPGMLVMVHRRKETVPDFFKRSMTKRIAANTTVPLLVYPYPAAVIPQF